MTQPKFGWLWLAGSVLVLQKSTVQPIMGLCVCSQGHVLSKYGFRTESNGVLRVRLQVVHQSQYATCRLLIVQMSNVHTSYACTVICECSCLCTRNYVEVQEEERKLTTLRGQLAYELCDFEHVSV